MAILTKHHFVSAKGDGSDATLVRPSNWNENHDVTMAANNIIGRLTAGTGAVEEIPATAYMLGILNTADYNTLAALLGLPTTGDAKLTFKSTADTGWILANDGSIGDALSNSTTRANADTQALFTFFYNGFNDAIVPVQTSTGSATTRVAQGAAATAFGAHCRIVVPKQLGRALIIGGTGTGLSARALGDVGGEENHLLTAAELPVHTHTQQGTFTGTNGSTISGSISGTWTANGTTGADASHTHNVHIDFMSGAADRSLSHTHGYASMIFGTGAIAVGPSGSVLLGSSSGTTDPAAAPDHLHRVGPIDIGSGAGSSHTHAITNVPVSVSGGGCSIAASAISINTTISGQTGSIGSGTTHNNMQPWTAWNIMIRL